MAVAPICIRSFEVSSFVSLNFGFMIIAAARRAISEPPPIPNAGGIAVFPILNWSIRKAAIPINTAGKKILFFNITL